MDSVPTIISTSDPALQPNSRPGLQGCNVIRQGSKALQGSKILQLQVSRVARLQISRVPRLQNSRLPGFWGSKFEKSVKSTASQGARFKVIHKGSRFRQGSKDQSLQRPSLGFHHSMTLEPHTSNAPSFLVPRFHGPRDPYCETSGKA